MKSPGKYVDRSLEDLIQHQQSGWLTGKINSTLPCFILCTGRLGRCWWFLSTTISKLFQQIASDELLIICGMYHGSTHHFQGLLCLRSILNIEPKHILWSRFGLKEEHFDKEQRYMMFLLQRGTDASYKTERIFLQWQDLPTTEHYWARTVMYCCHLTTYMCKDHCFSHSYIKESPLISYHGVLVSCKMTTPPLLSVLKVHWTVWLI